jgi:hypothetical protein
MSRVTKLWQIPPENRRKEGEGIEADFWYSFAGFITNGSDGVIVMLAQENFTIRIRAGDVIISDSNLEPKSRDFVIVEESGEWRVRKHLPSQILVGVVVAIVNLTDAHRRQREK